MIRKIVIAGVALGAIVASGGFVCTTSAVVCP